MMAATATFRPLMDTPRLHTRTILKCRLTHHREILRTTNLVGPVVLATMKMEPAATLGMDSSRVLFMGVQTAMEAHSATAITVTGTV